MTDKLALIVLGKDLPFARCDDALGTNLECSQCGAIIIEGYLEDCFAGIAFRCFRCGQITFSKALDVNEVPQRRAGLVERCSPGQGYVVDGTVSYTPAAFICDADSFRANVGKFAPKESGGSPYLIGSPDLLTYVKNSFEDLSGHTYEKRKQRLDRNNQNIKFGLLKDPLIAAISTYQDLISEPIVNLNTPERGIAEINLWCFAAMHDMWSHHPQYAKLAGHALRNGPEYYHLLCQLLSAAYLYQSYQHVGFSTISAHGDSMVDLYFRQGAVRTYIEVKTVQQLIAIPPKHTFDLHTIEKKLIKILQNSSQINKSKPGAKIVPIYYGTEMTQEAVLGISRKILQRKGRDAKYLSNIVVVLFPQLSPESAQDFYSVKVLVATNPHYALGEPLFSNEEMRVSVPEQHTKIVELSASQLCPSF